MYKGRRSDLTLLFFIAIPLFGILTTLTLAAFPPTPTEDFQWRKPLIGSILALICTLGIAAAVFPRRCSSILDSRGKRFRVLSHDDPNVCGTLIGHHPNCGEYSAHLVATKRHVWCAACTGLVVGAVATLVGTALYFFGPWTFGPFGFYVILIGEVFVAVGFVQLKFRGAVRSALNALLAFGSYAILAGTDAIVQNVFIDLYLIGLIVLWIWTRTLISQWDHNRICRDCEHPCEVKEKEVIICDVVRTWLRQ